MHRIESSNYIRDSAGRNLFTDGPPGTTANDAWLNTIQEEFCNVIEWAGLSVLTKNTDTRDQLRSVFQRLTTSFDVIISSQPMFNNIVERVSANRYRIKDQYKSVYFKTFSGGFKMAGASSPLSGGDTWGYLETNQTILLFCENGETLDFGNTQGYLKITTDYCSLYNCSIIGLGTVASAISYSFLNAANYVNFFNCKTYNRLSSTNFTGFEGGSTTNQRTSKYMGCCVYSNISSGGNITGFSNCANLSNCYVTSCTTSFAGAKVQGFYTCNQISNCSVFNINTSTFDFYGFYLCNQISNCLIKDITASSGDVFGFNTCVCISNCLCDTLSMTSDGYLYGYYTCEELASCKSLNFSSNSNVSTIGFSNCQNITSCLCYSFTTTNTGPLFGFHTCLLLSSCNVTNFSGSSSFIRGFYSCVQISSCRAYQLTVTSGNTAYGFDSCDIISACYATTITTVDGSAIGFVLCKRLAACKVDSITASGTGSFEGFRVCTHGSSLYTVVATNAGNDYMDTTDVDITNKISCEVPFT